MTCVKCGYGRMLGPRYTVSEPLAGYGKKEYLAYTCNQCGYEKLTDCVDTRPAPTGQEQGGAK